MAIDTEEEYEGEVADKLPLEEEEEYEDEVAGVHRLSNRVLEVAQKANDNNKVPAGAFEKPGEDLTQMISRAAGSSTLAAPRVYVRAGQQGGPCLSPARHRGCLGDGPAPHQQALGISREDLRHTPIVTKGFDKSKVGVTTISVKMGRARKKVAVYVCEQVRSVDLILSWRACRDLRIVPCCYPKNCDCGRCTVALSTTAPGQEGPRKEAS